MYLYPYEGEACMLGIAKEQFIREYSKKVMDGNAVIFAGAGLSQRAGYVNWKELLSEIADDLGLKVDREYDLIALAQYHHNQRRSRAKLNEKLVEEFTKGVQPTENHTLIAQLPIHAVWTTNYDTLIEDAFKAQHKRVEALT
jgi:NAD-dependent SIR2 family protein deacetylase